MQPEQEDALARQTVRTVDGADMPLQQAHRLTRVFFIAGWCLLPWIWFVNVWLFWPSFRAGSDPIKMYTRWSALGFIMTSLVFLPWMVGFMIGKESFVGHDVFVKWNAGGLNLQEWGLGV
ncbi:hypothetical protein WJX84_005776 [Apatococcus fuscideae]|uniref:Gamma-secretase subunit PEN-2 n=1 Tax=Apatococcus fuscideae TaxID=2026836 RepID=A0AAW1SRP1_9CHLO